MKKYFIKNTEKEVKFGEKIKTSIVKGGEKGVALKQYDVILSPITLPMLLDDGVLEERGTDEEDIHEDDEWLEVEDALNLIEGRLNSIESTLDYIKAGIERIQCPETKKSKMLNL